MTTPLELYIAPAAARPGFWRLLAGIALILAGWLGWTVVVMASFVLYKLAGGLGVDASLQAMNDLVGASSPGAVMFQLLTFAGIWPGTWLALRLMHRQPFATLYSPERRVRWGDFWIGVALAAVFWAITMAFGLAVVGVPGRTELPLTTWLIAFVPLVFLIFMQASGEELIFRGYILQQLSLRWRNPLIWAALPAFLFGLAHYSSGSALGIGWYYVAVTLLFGATAAAMVWRTGSLAAAMGLHTGMNVFALSGIGLEGIVEGTQLYLYDPSGAKTLFIADGVATLFILLIVLSPLCPFRARNVTRAIP